MKPLVSVVVPVYKVEKYLIRCLDSLCKQSLSDIEILLINDASPDRCGEICEAYSAKDKRVRVFHHNENKGLSAARNTGIKNALADYIMFVDSDDFVHEDFCKLPYESAVQYQADLVMFGYQKLYDENSSNKEIGSVSTGVKTREQAIEYTFDKVYGIVAWNKLYKKSLFDDILFPEGIIFEDVATSYKIIWKSTCIFCIDKVLYYYCFRQDSLTLISLRCQTLESIRDQFAVCWQQCNDLSQWGYNSVNFDLYRINVALRYCMKKSCDYSDSYYLVAARFLQNLENVPNDFNWKRELLLKIIRFSPRLFSFVCKLYGKQIA